MKPGTVLGQRYTVTKELGKGSFSVVVEAVDAEAKRNVAIKLVPEAIGPKQCQASVNEAKILAQLEHNHIIKLYGAYHVKGFFALIMELLRGGELFDRIIKKQFYPEIEAAAIVRQLLLAISYLHEHNIAHRDLKPENIIFETADDNSAVKITDFGFAKVFDPSTMLSKACGTPLYVPPEILCKIKYDTKCDMWSLGVSVFFFF